MTAAFIVILILCSPIILGPLLIPTGKRLKAYRAISRMRGDPKKGQRLPDGLQISPLRGWCKEQLDANLTKVECGGRLHGVDETLMNDGGDACGFLRISIVCFACGRLVKTGHPSLILGASLEGVTDAATLERAVIDARRRQRNREIAAIRAA